MITGWIQYGGKWYYLNPANEENPGLMVSDCTMTIGGQTYVFKADGAMRAGWEKDADGGWYYYDTYTGQIKSGWQYIGGAWYYLDPNNGNRMLEEGWHEIGGDGTICMAVEHGDKLAEPWRKMVLSGRRRRHENRLAICRKFLVLYVYAE